MADQYRAINTCNMRQEASTKAAIAAVVQKGAIVHVAKIEGGWAQVELVRGWISAELLEAIDDTEN